MAPVTGLPTGKRTHKPTTEAAGPAKTPAPAPAAPAPAPAPAKRRKGMSDRFEAVGGQAQVTSPRDPASGLATGKRTHKPMRLTTELDRTFPLRDK